MRKHRYVVAILAALAVGLGGVLLAQTGGSSSSANETFAPNLFGDMEYRMVGPSRGGRVTAVAGHRDQPATFYMGATGGGVWKTTDYGSTWLPISDGFFKTDSIGAIRVAESDPNIIYVSTGSDGLRSNVIIGTGVYKSTDAGETNLEAHPTDPDVLWGMAEGQWRSDDGGKNWRRVSTPHGDNHDMWVNPDMPHIYIQSNDGGANVTLDDGQAWSTQNNQPTAELYQVDISDEFPYRLYAGQQDNSTISVPSLPPRSMPGGHTSLWQSHGGCETGLAVPKPGDPDIVYANCKGRFGVYNRRTGQEQQYYVGFWNIYGHNPKDLAYLAAGLGHRSPGYEDRPGLRSDRGCRDDWGDR